MTPALIIAALNGALSLSETLLPLIDQMKASGQLTAAQETEMLAKYNSLKAKADGQFSGPAWQQSGHG